MINRIIKKYSEEEYKTDNEKKLLEFDRIFKSIVYDIENRSNKKQWLNADGSIKFNLIVNRAGQMNSGSFRFYKSREGKCLEFPSKDHAMIVALVLEMNSEEFERFLYAAGWDIYPKNLKDFIIYVGINNSRNLIDIQSKLSEYGYFDMHSLQKTEHIDDYEKMLNNELKDYFKNICEEKGLKQKKVLKLAKLIDPNNDLSTNHFYYNGFLNNKKKPIQLKYFQLMNLMESLALDFEEKQGFCRKLIDLGALSLFPEELKAVNDFIYEGKILEVKEGLKYEHNKERSVVTSLVRTASKEIEWDKIDEEISSTFYDIKRFAVFYKQILEENDYKSVSKFIKDYALSSKIQYEYVDGLTIPERNTISVLALILPKITLARYNSLLKKAGKYVFNQNEESIVVNIMTDILKENDRDCLLLGLVIEAIENCIYDLGNTLNAEMIDWYIHMSKFVDKRFAKWLKEKGVTDYEKYNTDMLIYQDLCYSQVQLSQLSKLTYDLIDEWRSISIDYYGYDSQNEFLQALDQLKEELVLNE